MATGLNTAVKLKDDAIRFEIRDGMRRVSCAVLNEALEAAAGLPQLSAPMLRRRSFDRMHIVTGRATHLGRREVTPATFEQAHLIPMHVRMLHC